MQDKLEVYNNNLELINPYNEEGRTKFFLPNDHRTLYGAKRDAERYALKIRSYPYLIYKLTIIKGPLVRKKHIGYAVPK